MTGLISVPPSFSFSVLNVIMKIVSPFFICSKTSAGISFVYLK